MPAPDGRFRLLILGGTAEAAALARDAAARWGETVDLTTALAGRLDRRPALPGRLRMGGFGGAGGLADFLRREAVDALVDATHPFSPMISRNAHDAATAAGVPRLVLCRPAWAPQPGDDWRHVASLEAAAALLPSIADRVFLTTGIGGMAAFADLADTWFLVRLMAEPKAPLPLPRFAVTMGRPPYALVDERRLIKAHRIQATVTKNSGGAATEAKLAAAREAGIPVIMVDRPPPPPGETVADVDAALAWLAARLG